MVKRWTLAWVFFACFSSSLWGADVTPGSREAAQELLKTIGTEKMMETASLLVDLYPKLAPYKDTLLKFFEKYRILDIVASRLSDLYAGTFTEPELREMIAFFRSPVGEKLLSQTPALLKEEKKIIEKIFEEHKAQFEEMIRIQAKEDAPPAQEPERETLGETVLDRANRLFDADQWADARDAYIEYLKSDPKNVDVMTDLGICYRELADFEDALREFNNALALNPEHWQALYNKIIVLGFDLKKSSEAQALLSRLRVLQPHNSDVEKLAAALAKH